MTGIVRDCCERGAPWIPRTRWEHQAKLPIYQQFQENVKNIRLEILRFAVGKNPDPCKIAFDNAHSNSGIWHCVHWLRLHPWGGKSQRSSSVPLQVPPAPSPLECQPLATLPRLQITSTLDLTHPPALHFQARQTCPTSNLRHFNYGVKRSLWNNWFLCQDLNFPKSGINSSHLSMGFFSWRIMLHLRCKS